MSKVYFKHDGIPGLAHPLIIEEDNRVLSLAGDNGLRSVGNDYVRTYLLLSDNKDDLNDKSGIILDTYAVTPEMLADAMQWLVTGDIAYILKYV